MIGLTFIIISTLLLLSAFCSAIETAFTAASPAKIHKIKSEGNKLAQKGIDLIKVKDKVISTFLILYSILNTIATTIATSVFISIYGEEGAVISSIVMATTIIVFTEVIPKAIAVAKAERIVVATSRAVQHCLKIMFPINFTLSYAVKIFCSIFKINLKQYISPVEEVRGMIMHHHVEGNVEKLDRDMIDGVLDISHMTIEDIMIHRSKIVSISYDLPLEQMLEQALLAKHTKIPIWRDNTDNIVSVLDVRKLLLLLHKNNFNYSKIAINDVLSEPWFIPETILVSKQLQNFKNRPDQIAFIVNEYGDLEGMVTIKDIIEEIVGHIHDDEKLVKSITQIGKKYIINGDTTIREINRELDWNLPEDDANTIAGLIINKCGSIPEKGDKLTIFDLNVTIRQKIANKILSVTLQRQSENKEETGAAKP